MNSFDLAQFDEVWVGDYEFGGGDGNRPVPVCLVAHGLRSGKKIRLFRDEILALDGPPYSVSKSNLFVAYFASAELTCHLALGWPLPENVLDLYVEFKNLTNGRKLAHGASLLGALAAFGEDSISVAEKDRMRELALRGGPWTEAERAELLDYCESDVIFVWRALKSATRPMG